MSKRPIANPRPSTDCIAGSTIGSEDTALRLLSASIAAAIPADASRDQADGTDEVVRGDSPRLDIGP
jgi:hypothetical protein